MYEEYERAVGAKSGSRISLLGWLGIAAVMVSLIGATGAFFAYRYVKSQVAEVAAQLRPLERLVALDESPMVASVVARTLAAAHGVDVDEDLGLAEVLEDLTPEGPQSEGESIEGSLRIRTGDGDFTADLDADDERGRLIVRRPDGSAIVDLSADEEGGRFVLRVDGEEMRIEAGDRARGERPAWVDDLTPAPRDARFVLSGRIGGADFGAITWTDDDDPREWAARMRARLSDAGWRLEAEHDLRDQGSISASVVAHDPATGRALIFAAGTDDGATTLVQGWAERGEGAGGR